MTLEELAAHFDGVRMNGRGFRARCPAHGSQGDTLQVIRGEKGWLVRCYAGCTFAAVADAAGLKQSAFMYGDTNSGGLSAGDGGVKARDMLRSMILQERTIPTTLRDIAQIALQATDEEIRYADDIHAYAMDYTLPEASRMHVVVSDGALFTIVKDRWQEFGSDWFTAKEEIWRKLWKTYRVENVRLVQ